MMNNNDFGDPFDLSSSAEMLFTVDPGFEVSTKMPYLLNWLELNLVQIIMIPRWCMLMRLVVPYVLLIYLFII